MFFIIMGSERELENLGGTWRDSDEADRAEEAERLARWTSWRRGNYMRMSEKFYL